MVTDEQVRILKELKGSGLGTTVKRNERLDPENVLEMK